MRINMYIVGKHVASGYLVKATCFPGSTGYYLHA